MNAIALLTTLAAQVAPTLVDGAPDSDGPVWLLALGPAGAIALYGLLFRYYRNTDKRHNFERETAVKAQVTGNQGKVGEVRRTRNRRIEGDNVAEFRQRVRRVP